MKLIKPSRTHTWSTLKKLLKFCLLQFSLKTLKKHLFKTWFTWLVYISSLIFVDILSTCNSPRSNLSVKIFLILLLPSNFVKISFRNTLLISVNYSGSLQCIILANIFFSFQLVENIDGYRSSWKLKTQKSKREWAKRKK